MAPKLPLGPEGNTIPAVADVHDAYEPASRIRIVDWLRVPSVSGLQCVQALRRAGFAVSARLPGCAELRGQGQAIQVPLAGRLEPEVLAAILHKAGMTASTFLMLLDE
jgi:hypothetical protein